MQTKLFILLLFIIGKFPLVIRQTFGRGLGGLFSYFPLRDKEIAELQIGMVLPHLNARKTAGKTYQNFGMTTFESLHLDPLWKHHPEILEDPAWDQATAILSRSQGLIALTGHIGNWDLLAASAVKKGFPLLAAGRQARFKSFHAALEWLRGKNGIKTLWREDLQATRDLLKALNEKNVIAALVDQDTEVESIFSNFFGKPAKTPSSLVKLALKKNILLVSAFCVRKPSGGFRIILHELTDRQSAQTILDQYHAHLESIIREYPEQWVWFHKRWRTSVTGGKKRSEEYVSWLREQISQKC